MKSLARILVAAGLFIACGPVFAGFEGEDHTNASLLLSDNSADVKLAAKVLARMPSKTNGITDLVAEALWRSCKGQRSLDEDTQAWLAIALGKSGKGRYRTILNQCRDAQPGSKVTGRLEDALEELPVDASPQMRGGAWDLSAIAAQLAASVKRDAGQRQAAHFADIAPGQPLTIVYRAMGLPDSVAATSLKHGETGGGPVRMSVMVSSLIVSYDNAGTLIFQLSGADGGWIVDSISGAGMIEPGTPVPVARIRQRLATSDARALQAVALDLIARNETDQGVLDEVGRRIWDGRAIDEKNFADAMSHLCKALGHSKEGRYRKFLLEVAETAETHRLRSHAEDAAEELPEGTEPAFDPRVPRAVAEPPPQVVAPAPVVAEPPTPAATPTAAVAPVAGITAGATVSLKAGADLRLRANLDAERVSAEGRSVVLKVPKRDPGGTWWYATAGERSGWVLESELEAAPQ
jgi:hypothetical protein